jgi:hypothetical protein
VPAATIQLKVTLLGFRPAIWRRVVVPGDYSFFDLHIAIQSAMGWRDGHLHAFRFPTIAGRQVEIGIPVVVLFEERSPFLKGWEVPITKFLDRPGARATYEYDFGDGWVHDVVLEEIGAPLPGATYPMCLAGARACPPENCGGIPGYRNLLRRTKGVMNDSFDPASVRFVDTQLRLKRVLETMRREG